MDAGQREQIMQRLDRHEGLLAGHDTRLDTFEHDGHKIRERLGALEGDRELVRELAASTRELGNHAKALAEGIEAIAERAVEKVLERRSENRRLNWKFRLGWTSAAIAVVGFLWDHLHPHVL